MRAYAILLLPLTLALFACVSPQPRPAANLSPREQLLVGAWDVDVGGFQRRVIIRHDDYTFEERVIRIHDYAKAAVRYRASGRWRLEGGRFCITYMAIGYVPDQSIVGQEQCEKILGLTATTLDYFPEDSPRIVERKITDSAASRLWKGPLRLIGIYSNFPIDPSYQ